MLKPLSLCVAAATAVFGVAPADAQRFTPGDRVEAATEMMDSGWEHCIVVRIESTGDISVACGPEGHEYVVQAKWVRRETAGGQAATRGAARDPNVAWRSRPTEAQAHTMKTWHVGDRVEASPDMMDNGWESCVIIKIHTTGDVGVACGPRGYEYVVQARWVRAAGG